MTKSVSDMHEGALQLVEFVKEQIFVVEANTGKTIFVNEKGMRTLAAFKEKLAIQKWNDYLKNVAKEIDICLSHHIFEDIFEGRKMVFTIDSHKINWLGRDAVAHIVMDVTELREKEEIAQKDALTGVYNRRFCLDMINYLLGHGQEFSICFIDMDRLKMVNDELGHNVGDEYIVKVVEMLNSCLRSNDCLCRIGGDEFVIIFPNGKPEGIFRKMEEIRKKIISASVLYMMSISYGIVHIDGTKPFTVEEVLEAADKRMYDYKHAMRRQ
jgi:diguanylate cyclase (GGDEF)-like protein